MISLESGAALALGNNNGSVKNLIELGEVEPEAPPGKAFIPHSSHVGRWRAGKGVEADGAVSVVPLICLRVEGGSAAKSTWAIDLAESINGTDEGVAVGIMGEGALQTVEHGIASDGGVDSEEHVVQDDECIKGTRLADSPGLVTSAAVVRIQ